ncbi:MAG: multidrug efflux pump subunit AcrB [Candidatus Azotimanducaceae bacterium]|jgi:multidrug efflux pump subunit AcrB
MVIDLMVKNSIDLVEFADQRDKGYTRARAVNQGASVRFRPVAMSLMSIVPGGLAQITGSAAVAEAAS